MVLLDSLSDGLNGLTFIHEITIQSLYEVGFNLSVLGTKITAGRREFSLPYI